MAELISQVASVTAGLLFMQALSAAFAYGFHNWGRRIRPRSRIIFSALACGMLIALLPIVIIVALEGLAGALLIPVVALLFGSVFMGVFALPGAWWVTNRLERIDQAKDLRSTFK